MTFPQPGERPRSTVRVAVAACAFGLLSSACVPVATLAPQPLSGDYSTFLVEAMAESAKRPAERVSAASAAAEVTAWRKDAAKEKSAASPVAGDPG